MSQQNFGDYVREERLKRNLGLRQFAKVCGFQPSNYCHVENGTLNPTNEQVEKIAAAFQFKKNDSDYRKLLDLAAEARKGIASDLQKLIGSNKLIPALLRTVEDEDVGQDEIMKIIEEIKSGRYKTPPSNLST